MTHIGRDKGVVVYKYTAIYNNVNGHKTHYKDEHKHKDCKDCTTHQQNSHVNNLRFCVDQTPIDWFNKDQRSMNI